MSPAPLSRRLFAEFLAATVVGSGIDAAQLSPGDTGLQLLENAAATAAGLFTFILMFGPVSGAHFNPVVSHVAARIRSFSSLRFRFGGGKRSRSLFSRSQIVESPALAGNTNDHRVDLSALRAGQQLGQAAGSWHLNVLAPIALAIAALGERLAGPRARAGGASAGGRSSSARRVPPPQAEGGSDLQRGKGGREHEAEGSEAVEAEEVAQQHLDLGDTAVGVGEDDKDAGDDRERRQQSAEVGAESAGDGGQREHKPKRRESAGGSTLMPSAKQAATRASDSAGGG